MFGQIMGLVSFVLLVAAMGSIESMVRNRRERRRLARRAAMRRHPAGSASRVVFHL